MGLSKSKQKCLNPTTITAFQASRSFQSDRLGSDSRLSKVPLLIMKKANEGTKRDENVHRQLQVSPGFRGMFRVSKKKIERDWEERV